MQAAPIKPGDDPVREQDDVENAQSERSRSAAGPHAFLKKPTIKQRESGDKNRDEDCPIKPKGRYGEAACRTEQCGRRGNQEDGGAKIG